MWQDVLMFHATVAGFLLVIFVAASLADEVPDEWGGSKLKVLITVLKIIVWPVTAVWIFCQVIFEWWRGLPDQ